MPIVIKEIQVSTVVEKKVILPAEISESTYNRLKEKVLEELSDELYEERSFKTEEKKRRER
jgi:hypothetical protein